MANTAIIPGSLAAIATRDGVGLAESFLSASVILILDCSGSMSATDAPGGKSRRKAAAEQLTRLQADHAGKLALVCFADRAQFSPGGVPLNCGSMTNMVRALEFCLPADDTGTQFILISDGQPDSESETLQVARQFKTPIATVFIGPESDLMGGRRFLEKLAQATGGQFSQGVNTGVFADKVELLLSGQP